MPAYQFTAIDASGKQQKGVLEGDSARQIRQQLRDKALIPVAVDPIEQKDKHAQPRLVSKKYYFLRFSAHDSAIGGVGGSCDSFRRGDSRGRQTK